jgi:hypothetical protein
LSPWWTTSSRWFATAIPIRRRSPAGIDRSTTYGRAAGAGLTQAPCRRRKLHVRVVAGHQPGFVGTPGGLVGMTRRPDRWSLVSCGHVQRPTPISSGAEGSLRVSACRAAIRNFAP